MSLTPYAAPSAAHTTDTYMAKYGIEPSYKPTLEKLRGYNSVIVVDDSGSTTNYMNTSDGSAMRWAEISRLSQKIIEAGLIFDADGVDLYFLNRGCAKNVKDEVSQHFSATPLSNHLTPLLSTLDKVIADKLIGLSEKKLLVYILTDGEPSDGNMEPWLKTHYVAKKIMVKGEEKSLMDYVALQFVMCTDQQDTLNFYSTHVDQLEDHVKQSKRAGSIPVNVSAPYKAESSRVHEHNKVNFTQGTYLLEILAGAIDETLDHLNERKVKTRKGELVLNEPIANGCCAIS